jgi:TFIIH basal transcription factor complex TTD-A subunit
LAVSCRISCRGIFFIIFLMVRAIRGALLSCDQAVKTIIMDLDNSMKFIIEDLDDTHLFIDANMIDVVQEKLEEILENNTYRVDLG